MGPNSGGVEGGVSFFASNEGGGEGGGERGGRYLGVGPLGIECDIAKK